MNQPAERTSRVLRIAPFLIVGYAAIASWIARYDMITDGVSYLDLAKRFAAGDFSGTINTYWNPLYPVVLGTLFRVFRTGPIGQYWLFHVVNFGVFVLAFCANQFFWRTWFAKSEAGLPSKYVWLVSYCAFASACVVAIGLSTCNPDLAVAASCLAAAGLLGRLWNADFRLRNFAMLATVLALGYYAKAIMFPIAFTFFAAAWVAVDRAMRRRVVVATLGFLILCAPLIAALSSRAHHLTYSEVGKIGYAEYVTYRWIGAMNPWIGEPAGSGTPAHPLTVISKVPMLVACDVHWGVTDPFWFDPPYWKQGIRVFFNPVGQFFTLYDNSLELFRMMFGIWSPIIGCLSVLVLATRFETVSSVARRKAVSLLIPCGSALVLYMLILMEPRYLAPFLPLACASAVGIVSGELCERSYRFVRAVVAVMVCGTLAVIAFHTVPDVHDRAKMSGRLLRSSRELQSLLPPGARTAFFSREMIAPPLAYLSQVEMSAIMPPLEEENFWTLSRAEREAILQALRDHAIVAVVARPPRNAVVPANEDWVKVGDGLYVVKMLRGAIAENQRADGKR